MTTLNRWRIYCETDAKYEYIWKNDTDPYPTTCPTDTGHTITSSLTRIIDSIEPNSISIKQESTATGNHFRWTSIAFTALASQTTTYTFSFPMSVTVLSATWQTAAENTGDVITWAISKDTVVGAITANVDIDDTVINVSSTVTDNCEIGFYINLFDGVNTSELTELLAIDKDAGTITVNTASDIAYSAATPTYVRFSVPFMKDVELGHPCRMSIGESKITGSYVPAGVVVSCEYTNNTGVDKRICSYLEILY